MINVQKNQGRCNFKVKKVETYFRHYLTNWLAIRKFVSGISEMPLMLKRTKTDGAQIKKYKIDRKYAF